MRNMLLALLLPACLAVRPLFALSSADLKTGIESGQQLFKIDSGVNITENLTFPADCELEFSHRGYFELAPGITVSINGRLSAGETHIFRGGGRVDGRTQVSAVLPQWFGAKGDGVADDAEALQRAADLAQTSSYRKLVIPAGRYRLGSPLRLRCNVDCFGVLARIIEIDEKQTGEFSGTYMPMYIPARDAAVIIEPDEEWLELDPQAFSGIRENSFKLPVFAGVGTLDGKRKIDLAPGGTLWLESTDFFTARKNVKGDEFYLKNDICSIVSPQGDVFPEFIFDYKLQAGDAAPWDDRTAYRRGDYCTADGRLFKCSYPSGPGSAYVHRFKGAVPIGPVSPANGERLKFKYRDGSEDSLRLWVAVKIRARYVPPQLPVTVNNLAMEISSIDPQKRMKPIRTNCLIVRRSGVTFNRLNLSCTDRYSLISTLMSVNNSCGVTFNDGLFSGATFHGLGYNIVNGNAARIVYNNCVSVNARKGMAGRHGKNITVNGGHYNVIDDHYGANYVIRGAVINAVSTEVPGYVTPDADVENWKFSPTTAFVFCGKNFSIDDCLVYNASGLFASRSDVGDCYGTVSVRNVTVFSDANVRLFRFDVHPDFDYAHPIRVPDQVRLVNITVSGGGRNFIQAKALNQAAGFPVLLDQVAPLDEIVAANVRLTFRGCRFREAKFSGDDRTVFHLFGNEFSGPPQGLSARQLGLNYGNFPALELR